ncbi:MAG: YvcK family protein [Bacilli bacterium]
MKKQVVVIGGGTGLSTLLKGLKQFPIDITAIVSVSDDGSSTGRLRSEFNTPAVGDIRKVLVSLAETEPLVEKLFNYRFSTTSDLNGHAVGNLLLTAAAELTGNMSEGVEALAKVLNLKGKVVPLSEDNVVLVARMKDGSVISGEHNITEAHKQIESISYQNNPRVSTKALCAIKKADLIILSMGSLFTSIIPNLLPNEVKNAIDTSGARIMYVCNMMTQPGETDGMSASQHVGLLNDYLGNKKIDTIIVNNKKINQMLLDRYASLEQKDQVVVDYDLLKGIKVISSNFFCIDNDTIRHDYLKLALSIFSDMLVE